MFVFKIRHKLTSNDARKVGLVTVVGAKSPPPPPQKKEEYRSSFRTTGSCFVLTRPCRGLESFLAFLVTCCLTRMYDTMYSAPSLVSNNSTASNPTARQRSESKIEALLQQNGFPSETIELAREKANKLPASRTNETDNSSDRVTLSLQFCSDHLDKEVRRIVRKSNLPVRIVYKQDQT